MNFDWIISSPYSLSVIFSLNFRRRKKAWACSNVSTSVNARFWNNQKLWSDLRLASLYNFHLFTFWLGHPNLPSMPLVHFQFGNFTNAQNPWILIPPGLALNWFHSHGTREISSVEFFFLTALLRLKTISWNQKSYSAIFFICSILR